MSQLLRISSYSDQAILDALKKHGNVKARAAEELNVSQSALRRRLRTMDLQSDPKPTEETIESTESGDTLTLTYVGDRFQSADEVLAHLALDMDIWYVEKVQTKNWEVTGKARTQKGADQIWKSCNRYMAITLRRLAPKPVQEGIAGLLSRAKWPRTPAPTAPPKGTHFMELSLYDCHLGKYAWGKLTGQDQDNEITSSVFRNAVHDLLAKTKRYATVDRIVIPVGHDFFQVDNWVGETTAGTRVDSTDDRFSKTFTMGVDAFRACIDQCLKHAKVELLYVPGNHDRATSFYLCKVLEAAYESSPHVSCDVQQFDQHKGRKYRKYGVNLIGYTHGQSRDSPRESNLPLIMATECKDWWNSCIDYSWRLGHNHTKKTLIVPVNNVFNGVRVERIPSLTATDAWHFDNGFIGNRRSAEAWFWDYKNGYDGQFPAYARA